MTQNTLTAKLEVFCWLCGVRQAALAEAVGDMAVRWHCAPCNTSQITPVRLSDVAKVARLNSVGAASEMLDDLDKAAAGEPALGAPP